MKLYRARAWRRLGDPIFDPLDASGSVGGALGWRFNDLSTPMLYASEVEALAILEVVARPGWEQVQQVLVATLEVPDGSVVNLGDLGIVLPSNWNARPAAPDSRSIAREFLNKLARLPSNDACPWGVRVPSVLSATDHNVLLNPARLGGITAPMTHRLPFKSLVGSRT